VTYWHYTCDHGHQRIGDAGLLLPLASLTDKPTPWQGRIIWLTDLAYPYRDALGLTSQILSCDRTAHRYRITDNRQIVPWTLVARDLSREQRDELELARGARPRHWYISMDPVAAVYDPVRASFPVERARL
jgi:hypothetical protein